MRRSAQGHITSRLHLAVLLVTMSVVAATDSSSAQQLSPAPPAACAKPLALLFVGNSYMFTVPSYVKQLLQGVDCSATVDAVAVSARSWAGHVTDMNTPGGNLYSLLGPGRPASKKYTHVILQEQSQTSGGLGAERAHMLQQQQQQHVVSCSSTWYRVIMHACSLMHS